MGLLRKTKLIWLPLLAMLMSAALTSTFIQSSTRQVGQSDPWYSHQLLPAAVYESCCPYRLPDNTTPAVFLLTTAIPDPDSVLIFLGWVANW